MHLVKLEPFTFPVPFNVVFRHSSAARQRTENFIVCATTDNSITGYGEGCPRSYVTHEDLASCVKFLSTHRESLMNCVFDVDSLRAWIRDHKSAIDQNPSAFCAIEIAILDALGRVKSVSLESLLGISRSKATIHYSAVLGLAPYLAYRLLSARYKRSGFTDVKIKISGILRKDQRKLVIWNKTRNSRWHVRLDANNLWSSSEQCSNFLKELPRVYWGIEEPLQPRDFQGMRNIANTLGTKIILDESCTNVDDLEHVQGGSWISNLRVSKMGGIIRSIEFALECGKRDVDIAIGAHVGETSLLTRSALAVVQQLGNAQVALEGAFGLHLLAHDLTEEVIQFDQNGTISLGKLAFLERPGLGIPVEPRKLVPLDPLSVN